MSIAAKILRALGVRHLEAKLEADLFEIPKSESSKRLGEFEYKRYREGDSKFEIELSEDLNVAFGETLSVYVDGQHFYDVTVTGKEIDVDGVRSPEDTIVVNVGDTVRVVHQGEDILSGTIEKGGIHAM